MIAAEPTLAQRDPVDIGAPARIFAAGGGGIAFTTAVVTTVLGAGSVGDWTLETAALVLVALAGIAVTAAASPFRAPFGARSHLAVLALAVAAFVLDEFAQASRDHVVDDDWGLVVLAVFLLVLTPFRPPRHLLIGGLASALVVGGLVVALAPSGTAVAGPFAVASAAMTVVLAPTLGSTAFAHTVLVRLDATSPTGAQILPSAPDGALLLSVQQETIARLEAEVVPLLSRLVTEATLSDTDGLRARRLATSLRAALVEDLTRGWLIDAGFSVTDPHDYAERMNAQQRTALRTTVASLPALDPERPGTARITGQDHDVELELIVPLASRVQRSQIAPLVPLLRSVFTRADVTIDEHAVVLVAAFHLH